MEGVLRLDAVPGKLDLEDAVWTTVGHNKSEQLLLPSEEQVLLISPDKNENRGEVLLSDKSSSQLQKDKSPWRVVGRLDKVVFVRSQYRLARKERGRVSRRK